MSLVLAAYVDGISTLKDGSVKVALVTQEIDSETAAEIFGMRGKLIKAAMSDKNISTAAFDLVEKTEITDTGKKVKTQSQRLRAVLYRLWEADKCGFEEFEPFYFKRMEALIEQVKQRLPQSI